MITVFRVTKEKHSADPLSGKGGLFVSGRWHEKGTRIVYCAQTLSLASLEFFVHFGKRSKSMALVSFDIAIPDALIERLRQADLPADWDSVPHSFTSAALGTGWIRSNRSAVLVVPSVHSRAEATFLINPQHPHAAEIKVTGTHPHKYDSRMWK